MLKITGMNSSLLGSIDDGTDMRLEGFESIRNSIHHVGVAAVEADSDVVEVHGVN